DSQLVGGRWRQRGPSVHLHPGAAQRPPEQLLEEEALLVGEVLGKRDAELGALASNAVGEEPDRSLPARLGAVRERRAAPLPIVDVGIVEAAPVADPAVVDLVVLAAGYAHQLAPPLPEVD